MQSQFAAWIDSFWHKDDSIPMASIEGLAEALNSITVPVDDTISDESENPVQNKVIKEALDGKANAADLEFKADTKHAHDIDEISGLEESLEAKADTADLAAVAFSGDYDDLDGKPTVPDTISLELNPNTYEITATIKKGNTTISVSQPIDLPLETMVVGGSYNDQTKKVALTLKNGQTVEFSVADLVSGLVRAADLAAVATSGDYDDLSNKPDLSGYATQADIDYVEAKVDDLEGRLPNNVSDLQDGSDYVKNEDLAAVATSGSYNDLDDTPDLLRSPPAAHTTI